MINNIILRREKPEDYEDVEILTREAFWNLHSPGCDEHYLVHVMRDSEAFVEELDFVAESDGCIVGHIAYTKALVKEAEGTSHEVLCFGPVSVLPEYQRLGIGSSLIEHTLQLAANMGYGAVLIYGDPDYYSRFGFVKAEIYDIATSDNYYADALQAIELHPDSLAQVSGCFFENEVYNIDSEAARKFDLKFPHKEPAEGGKSQSRFQELIKLRRPRMSKSGRRNQ